MSANTTILRFVESKDHTTSDQNNIALVQQGLDYWNLCGDLGTSNNGHHPVQR